MINFQVAEGPLNFFSERSFYRTLIQKAVGEEARMVKNLKDADLVVGSYGPSWSISIAAKLDAAASRKVGRRISLAQSFLHSRVSPSRTVAPRIWFTGENVRPPDHGWDLTLSFDTESMLGKNAYLPFWWSEVDLLPNVVPTGVSRFGRQLTIDELTTVRVPRVLERKGFVCAFINRPEPMRVQAITMLQRIGAVDVYGRLSGRRVGTKEAVAKNYRYSLCFENDVYPGYVTEKPFEAWGAGCVPLWRGEDTQGFLNESAMVNAVNSGGLDGLVARVSHLEENRDELAAMSGRPILLRRPDLTQVLSRISEVVRRR